MTSLRTRITSSAFGAVALATTALPSWAEPPAPLQQMQASRVMYDTGVELRDPLLVVAAAKLRLALNLERTERGEAAEGALLDGKAMLDTARDFATGDGFMLGLIEDVAAEQTKGVTNGPVYNIARISGGSTDSYGNVPFDGGVYAEIYVEAQGNTDLNLRILDDQNRLVCSDTDASSIAYCGWRPREDGAFTIAVENVSPAGVEYSLITN